MDNNLYNKNGHTDNGDFNHQANRDSFYSYQQSGYQNNGSYQNTGYQNQGYPNNGTYQNQSYQTYQNGSYQVPPQKEKKKKERKPGGFGIKIVKCAALALVFGLVAGGAFEGVHYVSSRLNGENAAEEKAEGDILTQQSDSDKIKATPTSSTYVGTDVSDIVEASMPSIVAITNVSETEYRSFWGVMPYESTSCGSGIIVSQDDKNLYIATNNHVVEGANKLTVTFDDDTTVSAEIKGTDPSTDLAVIRVELGNVEEGTMDSIKVATLGDSANLRVGEASIAIGNALGYGQSVTTGCISALNREVSVSDSQSNTSYTAELIQTDAAINPGNSGGALLNAAGEVIGINSVKYSDTSVEGIGYAIPINTATPIIKDLISKEKVDKADSAYLGISGVDVTSDIARTYNMPSGVYVYQLAEGSAAEKAGILKGDIITKFDGKEIGSMSELTNTLAYYKAGTTVDVTVKRVSNGEYEEQVFSVTLGKKI